MEMEQLRIFTLGYFAAVLRQAAMRGAVVAKMTSAPFSMAFSMASSASSPLPTP